MLRASLYAATCAAMLGFSSVAASAYIACSGNVCWHVHERYSYPAESRVVIHDDSWHWGPREHFEFREHEGRGYWRDDAWVGFGD